MQDADNVEFIKSDIVFNSTIESGTVFGNISSSWSRLAVDSTDFTDSVDTSSVAATASRAFVYQIISDISQKYYIDPRDFLLNT